MGHQRDSIEGLDGSCKTLERHKAFELSGKAIADETRSSDDGSVEARTFEPRAAARRVDHVVFPRRLDSLI